jgi:DNA-binding FadR family transcriptional regulator
MDGISTRAGARAQTGRDGKRRWRPARLASVIVEELAGRIVSGELEEGSVLPNEPALCEEFGFSRTVVREGLKLLEERGLVRVEQGRGTTVQPRASWNMLDPVVLRVALAHDDDMSLLDDLIAVRRLLESEMTRAAATLLTDAELAALAENLDRMAGDFDDYDRFRAADNAFHAIVMRASGNEVGLTIVRAIHAHAGVTPPLASAASRKALEQTLAEHRSVYEALVNRDGDLAAERISEHIRSAWEDRKQGTRTA